MIIRSIWAPSFPSYKPLMASSARLAWLSNHSPLRSHWIPEKKQLFIVSPCDFPMISHARCEYCQGFQDVVRLTAMAFWSFEWLWCGATSGLGDQLVLNSLWHFICVQDGDVPSKQGELVVSRRTSNMMIHKHCCYLMGNVQLRFRYCACEIWCRMSLQSYKQMFFQCLVQTKDTLCSDWASKALWRVLPVDRNFLIRISPWNTFGATCNGWMAPLHFTNRFTPNMSTVFASLTRSLKRAKRNDGQWMPHTWEKIELEEMVEDNSVCNSCDISASFHNGFCVSATCAWSIGV